MAHDTPSRIPAEDQVSTPVWRKYYTARIATGFPSPDDVLERYAEVWHSRSLFGQDLIHTPQWTVTPLSRSHISYTMNMRYHTFFAPTGSGPWDVVRRLSLHPVLQRLNYCKQLSTTNILFDIEATHNRLSHALGTVDICSVILQAACKTAPEKSRPSKLEAAATLLYALIHDLYHGPFGHSFDLIGDQILSTGRARIDKDYLEEQIQLLKKAYERRHADQLAHIRQPNSGDLSELVKELVSAIRDPHMRWELDTRKEDPKDPPTEKSMAEWLAFLARAGAMATDRPEHFWLRELVDSSLDSDRLDYLHRDIYYLHIHENRLPTPTRLHQMLTSVRVLPGEITLLRAGPGIEHATERKHVIRLHWNVDYKTDIQSIITLRSELYKDVYEAPAKRSFDEMLTHALMWLLRRECAVKGGIDQVSVRKILRALVKISDDELFHFLYEVGTSPKHALSMGLVHEIATGRPFQEVWRLAIPLASLPAARKTARDLARAWTPILQRYNDNRHSSREPVRALEDAQGFVREIQSEVLLTKETSYALAYLMSSLLGQHFESRQNIEELLWNRFIEGNGDDQAKALIEGLLSDLKKNLRWSDFSDDETNDLTSALYTTPLLFISIPWISADSTDGEEGSGSIASELIVWEHEDLPALHKRGEVASQEGLEITQPQKSHFYPISVFAPRILAADPQVREIIGRLMAKLVYSCVWYATHIFVESECEWWNQSLGNMEFLNELIMNE